MRFSQKIKLSRAMAGRKLSEAHKEAIGNAVRGRKFSLEHRERIAFAQRQAWAQRRISTSR